MPDPYSDDVAKKVAEDRARGRQQNVWFPPQIGTGQCNCGDYIGKDGYCERCFRRNGRSVNGPKEE